MQTRKLYTKEWDIGTMQQRRARDFNKLAEDPFIALDLYRMILGPKVHEGAFRNVYEYTKDTVIKVAADDPQRNNLEWAVWHECKDQPYSKWLAPCLMISASGHFLVQKRVRPAEDTDKMPKQVPQFFTDLKRANWGFIGKRPVCFDYHLICRSVDYSFNAMQKVKEWK